MVAQAGLARFSEFMLLRSCTCVNFCDKVDRYPPLLLAYDLIWVDGLGSTSLHGLSIAGLLSSVTTTVFRGKDAYFVSLKEKLEAIEGSIGGTSS
jgi:hypothetical protein